MELVVLGQSVWEDYFIEITLEYFDYDGQRELHVWTHPVGEWTRESFVDQTPFEIF